MEVHLPWVKIEMHSVTVPLMLFVLRKEAEDDHDFRLKTSDGGSVDG